VESTEGVVTARERTARIGGALINIHTDGALRDETLSAEALVLDALCVVDTVKVGLAQRDNVRLLARYFRTRFGSVALGTHTVVPRHCVSALGVRAAGSFESFAFINI
jgi:hypothetical protein